MDLLLIGTGAAGAPEPGKDAWPAKAAHCAVGEGAGAQLMAAMTWVMGQSQLTIHFVWDKFSNKL